MPELITITAEEYAMLQQESDGRKKKLVKASPARYPAHEVKEVAPVETKVSVDKAKLDVHLSTRPDKERLEGRGLIKGKDADSVALLSKQQAADMLATKLSIRPERAHLEAKGKIKDLDTHESQKAEKKKAAADLAGLLENKSTVEDLVAKGLITEADGQKKLGVEEAVKPKVKENLVDVAMALEGKLGRQPERERLETKGLLNCKDTKKQEMEAAAASLETKLSLRPARDDLEAKGKIKTADDHAAQKASRKETAKALEGLLSAQPSAEEIATKLRREAGKGDFAKVQAIVNFLDADQNGYMDPSEVKVLIAKISGVAEDDLPDDHPDVMTLANIPADELVKRLWDNTDDDLIDTYFDLLGLGESNIMSARVDWMNRAEVIFTLMDLDSSGTLDRFEVQTIMGPLADALIATLMPGESGSVTEKEWMDHCSRIQADHGVEGVLDFLSFAETQLAKYSAVQSAMKLEAARKAKEAQAQDEIRRAVKNSLNTKLSIRPERGHLEAKGKLKDVETHEAQKQTRADAKSALETSLGPKHTTEAQAAQAEKHAAVTAELGPLPEPDGHDWRNRAEHVFMDMDLDHSNTLEKEEIVKVCGVHADILLNALQVSEEHGNVSLTEWVGHIESLKTNHGLSEVESFLSFCEGKVADAKKTRRYAKQGVLSEANQAAAGSLQQKLAMQPEKARLQTKGVIKDKEEQAVAKMNKAAAAKSLETKLSIRPEKEHLEAKGKIKCKDTHAAQKAEKQAAKESLDTHLAQRPQITPCKEATEES